MDQLFSIAPIARKIISFLDPTHIMKLEMVSEDLFYLTMINGAYEMSFVNLKETHKAVAEKIPLLEDVLKNRECETLFQRHHRFKLIVFLIWGCMVEKRLLKWERRRPGPDGKQPYKAYDDTSYAYRNLDEMGNVTLIYYRDRFGHGMYESKTEQTWTFCTHNDNFYGPDYMRVSHEFTVKDSPNTFFDFMYTLNSSPYKG